MPQPVRAEGPMDALASKLTAAIKSTCPKAVIRYSDGAFTAKTGTMVFTLHSRSMTGEYSANTYKEEGPNYRGFLLSVRVEPGRYNGQAVVPQELHGPYYATYIDDPKEVDGKTHYVISFSYGSRIDQKLKKAIMDALPRRG
jgi:hypothetical protein